MCGIAAIYAYHYAAPEVDRDELRGIRSAMAHRGPDGSGEWFSPDGRAALGHRRLSILDLSQSGAQPMASPDGTCLISFNGEIYNFRELRAELEISGRVFRTGTDTEVLLALYQEKGPAMFGQLQGMFAFAIWDTRKNAMLLARDPFGIKPLYYADDGWCLRAASEVKALLAGGKVSQIREPAGAAGFFLMGSVPEPFTLYREIRSLPAGSYAWVDSTGFSEPKRYFSIPGIFEKYSNARHRSAPALRTEMHEHMQETVRRHFVSDVPVGVFLSSGIDSGALTAHSEEIRGGDVRTMTLGFHEFEGTAQDETVLASELARLYRTRHFEKRIGYADVKQDLPKFFKAMDQPSVDGLNTYLVSKMAAEQGLKVVLSGIGADELFGGYPSFRDVPSWTLKMAPFKYIPGAGKWARSILSSCLPGRISPKAAGLPEYGAFYEGAYFLRRGLFMPWELEGLLGKDAAEEGLKRLHLMRNIGAALKPDPGTPYARVSSMEMSMYMRNQLLRDADWAGMAHSLELRVPYVDRPLFEKMVPLILRSPGGDFKRELALSPKNPLPAAVAQRKKTGFVLPIGRWLDDDPALASWKEKAMLSAEACHWSRRWAYAVYQKAVS